MHRTPNKRFRQSGNTGGASLFHAERLPIDRTVPVYVVEGEKDVLAVESGGGVAVCSAGGAGKWGRFDSSVLHGRSVIVVADKDRPGEGHAQQVVASLYGRVADVVVVQAKSGKDAADHIAAGYGLDELVPVELPTVPAGSQRPRVWKATDLAEAEPVTWLAAGRIPAGAITYMLGPEGIGKSLFLVWLTATLTTGHGCPGFGIPAGEPRTVGLVLTEDDWATVARPRLETAGADLSKVLVICADRDGTGSPTFGGRDDDMASAYEIATQAAVLIVDAWADTLPAGLSVRDPQQARQALHPWKDMASATGCAVLLSGHTNRVRTGQAREAYGLTGEIRKKARMTLLAQLEDAADGTGGVFTIGPEKSNVAAPAKASQFRIESVQAFNPGDHSDGTVPHLVWLGDSDRSARDLFADAAEANADSMDREDRNEAEEWLRDYLEQQGGEKSQAVKQAAKKVGITDRALRSARTSLGVVATRQGYPSETFWALPAVEAGARVSTSVMTDPTVTTAPDLQGCGSVGVTTERQASRLRPNRVTSANVASEGLSGPLVTVVTTTQAHPDCRACGATAEPGSEWCLADDQLHKDARRIVGVAA